ncbi:flagellar assembly protein FliX, partial [Plastoroseomonas arctica]
PLAAAVPPGLSLLALQETGAAAERDARARARGAALIATLAALQTGLLRGSVDSAVTARLAALSEGEAAADPALAALLADITLRARVELARLRHGIDVAPE